MHLWQGQPRTGLHTTPGLLSPTTDRLSHRLLAAQAGQAARRAQSACWLSRRLGVRRVEVIVGAQTPHPDAAVVAGGEDVAVVGGDRVDRRVVRLHLANQVARLRAPQLDVSGSAAADDDRMGGQEGQSTNPVLVRIVQALDQFLALEIPLLDAVVAAG